MTITLRAAKGAALTHDEMDANFTTLDAEKADLSGAAFTGGIVLPKTSGVGIQFDGTAPAFGWRDILGQLYTRGVGAQDPAWAVYNGTIYQYQFAVNDEVTLSFHLPHDYVPGTDIHAHVHYSLKTGVAETLVWEFTSVFAKGFNQEAFSTPCITSASQATPVIAFQHMIAETPISSVAGSPAVLFANGLFQVDGIALVRVKLLSNSGAQAPFVHSIDLHYQSTNLATKGKAPDFYA